MVRLTGLFQLKSRLHCHFRKPRLLYFEFDDCICLGIADMLCNISKVKGQ